MLQNSMIKELQKRSGLHGDSDEDDDPNGIQGMLSKNASSLK